MTGIISNSKGFIAFILSLIALTVILDGNTEKKIGKIILKNSLHLSSKDYLKFALLDNTNSYENLSLLLIKDKLEKHPYIDKCDVLYKGEGVVVVEITEVPFYALLIQGENEKILTDDGRILPMLSGTSYINLPIVLIPENKKVTKSKNLTDALKILKAVELYDSGFYTEISSIDLTKKDNVILTMLDSDYPVIINKKDLLDNVLTFCDLYSSLKKENEKNITYIDLRFNDHIFIGTQKDNAMGVKEIL